MTALLTIRVPGKTCSVNAMYRNRANGGKYLSTTAVEWKLLTMLKTREAKHLHTVTLTTPLTITCRFYGTRKNADVDNLLKCTLDGLASGLGINDKHFGTVTAIKATGAYKDGAVIEVWASEATK
jgi:Holliday junction resolvase RusA-like endonuclease